MVAFAHDAQVIRKSGTLVYVADFPEEYGFTDDGVRVANFEKVMGLTS